MLLIGNTVLIRRTCQIFSLLVLLVLSGVTLAEAHFKHVGKVVAVGDLHGDYEQYLRVLKANDLVDEKLKWQGGRVHFVQMGDVTDRGPDSEKIIRHLMKLEKQAKKAGGRVHVLIGNHEAMNIQTDLRYVHPGEYSALINRQSVKKQQRYIDAVFRSMVQRQPDLADREEETLAGLEKKFPPGYVEHRQLWEPGMALAKWYARHNAVIQINDTIFLHGGLDPHVERYRTLEEINKAVRSELGRGGKPDLTVDQRGPLWYRGLAKHSEAEERVPLELMLAHYGAKRIMVGHSTTQGAVMPRFEQQVILADVGISAHYGGSLANVVVDGDRVYAMHRGQLVEIPEGDDIDAYLEKVASLEPEGSRLVRYVKSRSKPED